MLRIARFASLLPLLTLLSCASTGELIRRGEVAYDAGNMEKAYDWSRRALDRDPGNTRARATFAAAAGVLMDGRQKEVTELAALDTLAAARALLELDEFRSQLEHYLVTLPPDAEFDGLEAAVRTAAARTRRR